MKHPVYLPYTAVLLVREGYNESLEMIVNGRVYDTRQFETAFWEDLKNDIAWAERWREHILKAAVMAFIVIVAVKFWVMA